MMGLQFLLTDFVEKDGMILVFGENSEGAVMGIGKFEWKAFKLKNVFYVKGLKAILSPSVNFVTLVTKFFFNFM